MKIKRTIIVLIAKIVAGASMLLVVSASVMLLGGVLQKAQDAGVSASDPGFVPSTGQINPGFTAKLPSSAVARIIPSNADARAALFASGRETAAFDQSTTTGAVSSDADVISPIGASPQTIPAKFSSTNDTLDRVPIMAWPLELSDQQRERIYLAVMADQNAPATDTDNLTPASELSTQVALNGMYALPSSIGNITQVRGLKYVKTKDKVFLVLPANRIVVDAIAG